MKRILLTAALASVLCISFLGGCAQEQSSDKNGVNASSANAIAPQEIDPANQDATASATNQGEESSMNPSISTVMLSVEGHQFAIDLADNETAAAFAAMLPLQTEMSELNGNEKYVYLDSSLPTNASNPGTIEAGDVMLYGNSCLVVFYESHATSYAYTRIGKIADPSGLAAVVGSGSISASFAAA